VPGSGRFEGSNTFLRWRPKILLGCAFVILACGWNPAMLLYVPGRTPRLRAALVALGHDVV